MSDTSLDVSLDNLIDNLKGKMKITAVKINAQKPRILDILDRASLNLHNMVEIYRDTGNDKEEIIECINLWFSKKLYISTICVNSMDKTKEEMEIMKKIIERCKDIFLSRDIKNLINFRKRGYDTFKKDLNTLILQNGSLINEPFPIIFGRLKRKGTLKLFGKKFIYSEYHPESDSIPKDLYLEFKSFLLDT